MLAELERHPGRASGSPVAALKRLSKLAPTRLEQIEKLEQLRALENGMEIRVALAVERPLADVNTAADLERAERALQLQT